MSVITITITEKANQGPNSSGWNEIALDYNELYVFTVADFTTDTNPPYADPEGDPLGDVRITVLPTQGVLTLAAVPVIANDLIDEADIAIGDLKYQADVADTDGYSDGDMRFQVSDSESGIYFSPAQAFIFSVDAQENQPPTVVGDGSTTIEYGETEVFTRAMFTSGTIPAYSDPESDEAFNLRIDTLPTLGEIRLSGVAVIAGQVVSFADIDLGLLTYVPDLADTDGDLQSFTFSIADAGSFDFTS